MAKARKLTYWIAKCTADGSAYHVRARTRREVIDQLAGRQRSDYTSPTKVTVEFIDAFELIDMALGEGGALWER